MEIAITAALVLSAILWRHQRRKRSIRRKLGLRPVSSSWFIG